MKVYIGPYKRWVGPYQLANILKYVGVSEDRCHKIGEFLADTWVGSLTHWVYKKRKRIIKVRIDEYDLWSLDYTLAEIIYPALKRFKDSKQGTPWVDAEDVPPEIFETKEYSEINWKWVLDEMIWAFEYTLDDDFRKETEENEKRASNGRRLFAKYYYCLWN